MVDKNAKLEEENKKVSSNKPLLESYKHQIGEMEARASSRNQEIETLKFEVEQTRTLLRIAEEERTRNNEALDLFQDRIKELELTSAQPEKSMTSPNANGAVGNLTEFTEAELLGQSPDDDDVDRGLRAELDDAESGRTMTDLKIEIRKLKKELEGAKSNQSNSSDILVLQNLLEDSNRLKARYEGENLAMHRENLILQKNLEDIRSGKALGDGLVDQTFKTSPSDELVGRRQRSPFVSGSMRLLNSSTLCERGTPNWRLTSKLNQMNWSLRNLTVRIHIEGNFILLKLFSLVNLVNKDQVEMLADVRASVEGNNAELRSDMEKLRQQVKDLSDKNKMQLEQINGLLMEKVSMQSEGIGQRERMLERERNFRFVISALIIRRDFSTSCQ